MSHEELYEVEDQGFDGLHDAIPAQLVPFRIYLELIEPVTHGGLSYVQPRQS